MVSNKLIILFAVINKKLAKNFELKCKLRAKVK